MLKMKFLPFLTVALFVRYVTHFILRFSDRSGESSAGKECLLKSVIP